MKEKQMQVIAKILGIMFMSRTYAHKAHLWTPSYAKHMALNEFYTDVVELADTLAEAAQGVYGKLDIPDVDMKGDTKEPIAALESHIAMIENLGKRLDMAFLDNIYQEIQALYYQTLYKLKELD